MNTYCHISKKYILYFFQKCLIFFIILLTMSHLSTVNGQHVDYLKERWIKNPFSLKAKDNNDWNFEDANDFNINRKNYQSIKNELDIGALLYLKNDFTRGDFNTIDVPYNLFNSHQLGIKKYIKTIESKRKYFNFQIGIGTILHHLNLGENEANITDDTITFFLSSKEVKKNFFRFNYLSIPIKFNLKPFPSKKNTLQIGASFQYHHLLRGKYELQYLELNNTLKNITIGKLHHVNRFLSSRIQLSYKNIGVYVENGITSISTIFQSPYSLSFGVILCSYQ